MEGQTILTYNHVVCFRRERGLSVVDQACSQDSWKLAKFCFAFLWTKMKSSSLKIQKKKKKKNQKIKKIIIMRPISSHLDKTSLPADVLWGLFLFVTHSFLPTDLSSFISFLIHFSSRISVRRNECVTNKNKPQRTSAGRLEKTSFGQ